MTITDPIADFLTRLRNALKVKKHYVSVPTSKMKIAIAKILKEKRLITDFKLSGEGIKKKLIIYLRYDQNNEPFLENLKRISKPGRRIYFGYKDLKPLRNNFAFRILSTSRGVMTDDEARKRKLGGEVICEIY
ncbi:MAG: 30S ribosomal protein S8 [Candidatus Parcubacteria bacterium]|nr:MAG: 30S ribosomal protein S8 [Candidatus Parcubacteria bacterium]